MKKLLLSLLIIVNSLAALYASPAAQIGEKAPDFKLKSLTDNSHVSLSALRGKVVLLDFWASWCTPCKISMPDIENLSRKYKNLTLIAVNIDDDKANALKFLKDLKLDINAVYDAAKQVVSAYEVPEMPTLYLIDPHGKIQYSHTGYTEEKLKKLEFAIRGLLD